MATTPEGKIKKMVRAVLEEFSGECRVTHAYDPGQTYTVSKLYQFWPVPSGFGASSLDVIVCYYGESIYIETKAPGAKPTPRQNLTIAEITGAHGHVIVVDGPVGCDVLRELLTIIRDKHADHYFPKT